MIPTDILNLLCMLGLPFSIWLITEKGGMINNHGKVREHFAIKPGMDIQNMGDGQTTLKTASSINTLLQNASSEKPLIGKELDTAVKCLRTRSSLRSDNILNEILCNEEIPEWLQSGNITRLRKGKGAKGKCSNLIGLTLACNVGK